MKKKYKSDYHNPETFEKSEIETEIPEDLAKQIESAMNKIEGYFTTPLIINPNDLSITVGIMDMDNRDNKYLLTLKKNKNDKT